MALECGNRRGPGLGVIWRLLRQLALTALVWLVCVDLFGTPLSLWIMEQRYGVEVVAPDGMMARERQHKSRFGSFQVTEDAVTYRCRLTLRNHTSKPQQFRLMLMSPMDALLGLIWPPVAYSVDAAGREMCFRLEPGQTAEYRAVRFQGQPAGGASKWNKSLPMMALVPWNGNPQSVQAIEYHGEEEEAVEREPWSFPTLTPGGQDGVAIENVEKMGSQE